MENSVEKMIEDKQAAFKSRSNKQMEDYARFLAKAVKVGNIASAKSIKNS